MSRKVLIDAILSTVKQHPKSALSKKAANDVITTVFNTILAQVRKEGRVRTTLGTFRLVERPPREYRNPRTSETVKKGATKVLKFKPSAQTKKDLGN